jgi:hypothetical protein
MSAKKKLEPEDRALFEFVADAMDKHLQEKKKELDAEMRPLRKAAKRWKLTPLAKESVELSGQLQFQVFVIGLINDWPLGDYEKLVLAYIAERIWRKGRCRCSGNTIFSELTLVDERNDKKKISDEHQDSILEAVEYLEARGLIKRTAIGKQVCPLYLARFRTCHKISVSLFLQN